MATPFMPLINVGPGEEAQPGTVGAALPIQLKEPKNYAEDKEVMKRCADLVPLIRHVRDSRLALEQEWDAIRRIEMQKHDDGRRYYGRSDAYLPLYNKALGTRVSAIGSGLFPTDDYMDVGTRRVDIVSRVHAKAVKAYLQWEFERVAKLQQNLKIGLRSLENFGNAVYKVWYEKPLEDRSKKGVRLKAERMMLGGYQTSAQTYSQGCEGLRVSARPIHNVHVYPLTANSIDELTLIMETIDLSRAEVEELIRKNVFVNGELALAQSNDGQHFTNLDTQAQDTADLSVFTNSLGNERVVLQEIWTNMVMPKSAYEMGEDTEAPVPVRIVMAGTTPISVTRNPFWHQKPPYLIARTNVQPGFFYGYGIGRIVRHLQYLANDFANQTNDCGNYILNPVNKVDPSAIAGPMLPLAPGRTWYFTDIAKGQMFDRPPTDLITAGQAMMNLYISMLADYSGAPPVLQGTAAKGAAKTATGAQILQRNALNPLQDTVEDFENDVMEPLMWMTWVNAQQYRSDETFIQVAGQSLRFDKAYLDMDPEFTWMASSQAANQQQRAQGGMQLLQICASLAPMLAAQGKIVDFQTMIAKLASDGFGIRDFDQIIQDNPMAAMQAMGGPPGGGAESPPGGPREEGQRSAVPGQSAGEGVEEGEGEDFMDVRNQADEISAMLGASGGGYGA